MFSEKGQTLIELVVVVGIAAIVVGALVFATVASLRNAQFSKNQSQATKLAQEGIERVRSARDRNQEIKNLGDVYSWNGDANGVRSIWSYEVYKKCFSSDSGSACYFKFDVNGSLSLLGIYSTFPVALSESIPPLPAIGIFHRAIVLADDSSSYTTQKTVTVIVEWTDFSGPHQSKLTTILGRK